MGSVMAVVYRCQNGLKFRFNTFILRRLLILRQYHTTKLNIATSPYRGLFLRQFSPSGKCARRWNSDDSKGPVRNVSLVFSRGPLRWISNKIKLFLVHSYFDSDFDEAKFLEGAKQAICTVSSLVAQRHFNKLEGLLTDEAIDSLRDEITRKEKKEYGITMEDILQTAIHDIGFQYDEFEKGRKWLHVLVSYICKGNEEFSQKAMGNVTFIRIPLPKITRYSFRKECTVGTDDSWIITKIINLNQDTHPS